MIEVSHLDDSVITDESVPDPPLSSCKKVIHSDLDWFGEYATIIVDES